MTNKIGSVCLCLVLALFLPAGSAHGQGLTGQISGSVQDPAGSIVPGAEVELVDNGTGQKRQAVTDDSGSFVFAQLLPGRYKLSVSLVGFKKYEQQDIVLTATERVELRRISLELGELNETISVKAEAARLQTQSAERSGLISASQIQDLSLKGRDYLGLIRLLPGVLDTANREAPGWNNLGGITINGNRSGTINLTLDGVSSLDTGSMTGPYLAPGLDAIAEVKVLLTNYQAEYGRSSGGTINAVIKSGTRDFHGGAFYFKRHEQFNANEYFNNRNGLPKPQYRFNYYGYNIGGPVLVPGLIKNREKVFFFWSQEFLPRRSPTRQGQITYPTALERKGDFSQTFDTNGRLIPIMDPLNNRQPFSGNIIPQNRIDKNGQALLNIFPLPNTSDPAFRFNNVFQSTVDHPRREEILRVDWNVGRNTTFYARGIQNYEAFKGDFNFVLASNVWPQFPINYQIESRGVVSTLIHTFNPTLINEFTFGVNRALQTVSPLNQAGIDRNNRTKLGLTLPQFHPEINPLNLVPNATFGGVQNAPQLDIEQRFPFFGTNNIWNWSDNLSKIYGAHNLKVGTYIEWTTRNAARSSRFNGTFDFGRNVNNPFDTNYAFSNALLGYVNSYTESDKHPNAHARYWNVEWFAQDNWKLNRHLTLDVGARFYMIQPTYSAADDLAIFDLQSFNPAKAPRLIEPYRATPSSTRQGRNPVTGELLPEIKIGTFAPGTGDIYNGMKIFHEKVMKTPPIQVAPRVGFAWDIHGDGKTAVRGGIGIFPDRYNDDQILQLVEQPPLVNTPTANYTTIKDLLSTSLSLSPASVFAIQRDYDPPTSYNWSVGVQRDLGFKTVLDVAYVGSVARHLLQRRNLNALTYGTNFLQSSIDPTLTGNRPLPANFLRPFKGYGDINYIEFATSSNYHSMQMQVQRRFSENFMFGFTWTWSKVLDFVDGNNNNVNPFVDFRTRHYGRAGFDRLHNVVINYVYKVPGLSPYWSNPLTRWVTDGWEISGITSFVSGQPLGIGYSFVQAVDITGATGVADSTRVNLVADPNLPKSERTRLRHFRTEAVRPPDAASFGIGNAPKDPITGPGINNWDISIFKTFPLANDGVRRLQFRCEMYNAFNHTQFSGVDTGARFDAQGNQVNSRFGEYTSAQNSRRIQMGLKFYF
ncbi:MAG TPA: carboxypeptidase regulatory-like domain-containing protein [Acidobacteriota bacterium]|jgi:hypothetical protein